MAVSKVILNGTTLMDVTEDTVAANNLLSGETATGADGEAVTGAYVAPSFKTQSKSATPSETSQIVTPDTGFDGLSQVSVGAVSSTYVGSGIARKSSTDLTVSGATVSVPAGYYEEAASKSVSTTTHPNPTASINSSTGVVTASHTQTAGYVTAGTTTGTLNLSTQAAKTVTPTESEQTAVAAGRYTTGVVKVGAISSTYVGSGIAQNDSDDLTVSGATVSVPAGYYASSASKSVASGTAGTPTATKGTVSNNSVSVTPSVTNTTGYITGGTKNGIAVTVSASELVSGTKSITENGTVDVTNFASATVNVPVPSGYVLPTSTKASATYVPTTIDQTIASGTYLTGDQTISGDANLIPENIADGVSIFGISGTHQGGGVDDQLKPFIERTISGVYSNSEISYIGSGAFMGFSGLNEINIPNVTSISQYAFCGCLSLSSVNNLFSQLSVITAYAFSSCTYLKELSSPTISLIWNDAFNGCSRLSVINLPNVKSIYSSAFYNCYGIQQINFPSMTSNIASFAFQGCRNLYSISLPSVKTIDSSAFAQVGTSISEKPNIYMPNVSVIKDGGFNMAFKKVSSYAVDFDFPSLSSIGSNAFYGVHINTFSAPNLKSIGEHAFASTYIYDENFTLPSCTSIAPYAFSSAHLSKIDLPNTTTIGSNAFLSCYSLSEINAPKVTTIGSGAFSGCSSLLSVNAPSLTAVGTNAFNRCSQLSSINFPLLARINNAAFSGCTGLKSVSLPKVSEIGDYAFSGTRFASAYFPSCTFIGSLAFANCLSLSLIAFEDVYYIGSSAFMQCRLLTSVYFLGTRVPEMIGTTNVFSSTPIKGYTTYASETGYIYVLSSMYSKFTEAGQFTGVNIRSITQSEASAIRSLFS